MTVSILGLHCLNAVTDDYENLGSILDEVRRTSHGNVTADEVAAAVAEMVADGLVAVYRFEPRDQAFVPAAPGAAVSESFWFRITPTGRRELDANWVNG